MTGYRLGSIRYEQYRMNLRSYGPMPEFAANLAPKEGRSSERQNLETPVGASRKIYGLHRHSGSPYRLQFHYEPRNQSAPPQEPAQHKNSALA